VSEGMSSVGTAALTRMGPVILSVAIISSCSKMCLVSKCQGNVVQVWESGNLRDYVNFLVFAAKKIFLFADLLSRCSTTDDDMPTIHPSQ
jgi:hypothetical protein